MSRKVIITAAQTGSFHGKEVNPNLPEQPDEIAQSAYDCYNAGASIVHIHARDKDGKATNDPKVYSEIGSKVKAKCDMILQYSTAPKNPFSAAEDGLQLLYDKDVFLPEMCSLDCSLVGTSWKDKTFIFEWSRSFIAKGAARMKELGIKPELEVFNPTSIDDVVNYVYPQGVLDEPLSFTFVMGQDRASQGAMPYDPQTLMYAIQRLPKNSVFSAMAIGANQLPAVTMSMLLGGNMRVGFEDNVYYRRGELAVSNAQLVERAAKLVREFGFEVATPDEAREILGLTSTK